MDREGARVSREGIEGWACELALVQFSPEGHWRGLRRGEVLFGGLIAP